MHTVESGAQATKQCSTCQEQKAIGEFRLRKTRHGTIIRTGQCKLCLNASKRQWRHDNRERVAEKTKLYRRKREDPATRREKWKNDPAYRERTLRAIRKYRASQKSKDTRNARDRRLRSDPAFAVHMTISARLRALLRDISKSKNTLNILGCSYDELIKHLESQFLPGMTWENHGVYRLGKPMTWHVDHIRPVSSFDLRDPEQLKACFHYTNLQPLWAIDNMRKGNRR